MPEEIFEILKILNNLNYKAYLVGGALRDYLLGKSTNDYDIASSSRAEEVEKIFKDYPHSSPGKKFGTVIVNFKGLNVEITTFRIDSKYEDHRRPESVVFADNIETDLKRRDFTINALAMDKDKKIIDIMDSRKDLENRLIKSVGDPDKKIKEDALRMLRAVRFASQLNFKIDEDLKNAIKNNKELINYIAKERIQVEFNKILLSDKPSIGLDLLEEVGLLEILFPGLAKCVGYDQKTPYHNKILFDHIKSVVDMTEKDLPLRMAGLFHDIAKPLCLSIDENNVGHFYGHDILGAKMAEEILRDYKYPKKFINKVKLLIEEHMKVAGKMSDKALRRQIKRLGEENIDPLYGLLVADRLSTVEDRNISDLDYNIERIHFILENNSEILKKSFLAINGNDLMTLGFKEGKIIGEILKYLNELVIDQPEKNEKEILLNIVKNRYRW